MLEPSWFERFPVSENVTNFIIKLAREIPGMQIHVGSVYQLDLQGEVTYMGHPSCKAWPGKRELMPALYPHAPNKSYSSFTAFWKAANKKQTKLL